jgi:hypothetical protein
VLLFALAYLLRLRDGTYVVRSPDYPECEGRSSEAWPARERFRDALGDRVQQMVRQGQVPVLYDSADNLAPTLSALSRTQISEPDRHPSTYDTWLIVPVSPTGATAERLGTMRAPPVSQQYEGTTSQAGRPERHFPADLFIVDRPSASPTIPPVEIDDAHAPEIGPPQAVAIQLPGTPEPVSSDSKNGKSSAPTGSERFTEGSRESPANGGWAVARATAPEHPPPANRDVIDRPAVAPTVPPIGVDGAATLAKAGLSVVSSRVRLGLSRSTPLPHLGLMLASIAMNANVREPVCVILPGTDGLAETTAVLAAIEWLARDFGGSKVDIASSIFVPGSRVRTIAEGHVYEVGDQIEMHGATGFWLKCIDSRNYGGRIFVASSAAPLFERTSRKRPIGPPSISRRLPDRTIYDLLSGVSSYGNSSLMKNRVVLMGSRAEFERFLDQLVLSPELNGQVIPCPASSRDFCWGFLHEDGRPVVTHPHDGLGEPLVAVNRDPLSLRNALLSNGADARKRTVVTSEITTVLRNLDLIDRIAERQKVLLIAESRRRDEVRDLRERGWIVWEPRPWEIASRGERLMRTGVSGLDLSLESAARESRSKVSRMERRSPELLAAFDELFSLTNAISFEARDDDVTRAVLQQCRDASFQAAGWFEFPDGEEADHYRQSLYPQEDRRAFALVCGEDASSRVERLAANLNLFVANGRPALPTPKGDLITDLVADAVKNFELPQAIATGHPRAKQAAQRFFARHRIPVECLTPAEIHGRDFHHPVILTSALGRNGFDRIVDPWPAESIVLAGYDFEVGMYGDRLAARQRAQLGLKLDELTRSRITGFPSDRFGTGQPTNPDQGTGRFSTLDRLAPATEWDWSRRPRPVARDEHEQVEPALFCRFVGRSWAAFSEDHQCIVVLGSGGETGPAIRRLDPSELHPGHHVVMREAGERDVIRAIAEKTYGAARYSDLRAKSDIWREALKRSHLSPEGIAERLKRIDIRRNLATIRSWLKNTDLIGPRQTSDIEGIAEAFGEDYSDRQWNDCIAAVSLLRSLHVSAGTRLSTIIVGQCGDLLLDPAENEMAVVLDVGTAWILEVAHVDDSPTDCPVSVINRLQWEDDAWRARLMHQAQAAE